jgi:YjbE family integral membrane protein
MGIDSVFQFLALTLEVFFLDLLLSGDNAVVIALACRSLPARDRRRVMLAGTAIAIALRIVLTLLTSFVLRVPVLKMLGGIALAVIAVRLTLDNEDGDGNGIAIRQGAAPARLLSALATVVLADLAMSTDNVVALAAVAHGRVAVLALGLLLSVPLLMFGSWYVTALLLRYPALTPIGGAMLGWLAGDIAVSDPLYAGWIERQSPALTVVVPLLSAAYVLAQSRIIDQSRASAAAFRPLPRVEALARAIAKPAAAGLANPREEAAARAIAVAPSEAPVPPKRRADPDKYRWLIAPAIILAVMGVGFAFLSSDWMPAPAALIRYDCSARPNVTFLTINRFSLYYRAGANRIRITAGGNTVSGIVTPDNQIDWGDLHVSSTTLGFVPPTRVLYADAQTLRVHGGMFEDLDCHVR